MKKALLLLLVTLFMQTANAKIWLVDNNSTYITTIQAGHDSASVGDTVMVVGSSTPYTDVIITTPIVLIGEGMNNIYGQNTRLNKIDLRCSNVSISGIQGGVHFNTQAAASDTISNIIIERCYFDAPSGSGAALFLGGNYDTGPYGIIKNIMVRNNVVGGAVYLHDPDGAFSLCKLQIDTAIFENNIFYSTTFWRYIPASNILGLEKLILRNNTFIKGPSGTNSTFYSPAPFRLEVSEAQVENNIFFQSNPQYCDSCNFRNNLTFGNGANDTIYTTGINSGNIIANSTDTIFTNYFGGGGGANFDFSWDFNIASASPAIGAGLGGTDIGNNGGNFPLAIGEGARVPLFETISLTNVAVPQLQDFFLNLTARARRHFSDTEILSEIKYSFDTILPFGQGTDLMPLTQGLNVAYTDSIPPVVLDSGLHTITFIARDSKGAYSFPRTHTFNVCTYNEVVSDFDYYLYGRDVIFANNSTLAEDYYWDFGDGSNSSTQANPVHHYVNASTYNVSLISSNPCYSVNKSQTILIKGINTIYPKAGGNIGVVTMTVTGAGFNDSTTIKLTKTGEMDIIPSGNISVSSNGFKIKAILDLNGAALGLWNIIIEVPGDTTYTFINEFKVDSGILPKTYVDIIGPDGFRLSSKPKYSLKITNEGNVDAFLVPLWLVTTSSFQADFSFSIKTPHDTIVQIDWDTIPLSFNIDTLFGSAGNYTVYGFYLPYIYASSSIELFFSLSTTQTGGPFKLYSWTSSNELYSDSAQIVAKIQSNSVCEDVNNTVGCMTTLVGLSPYPPSCAFTISGILHQQAFAAACADEQSETYDTESAIWNTVFSSAACVPPVGVVGLVINAFGRAFEISMGSKVCFDFMYPKIKSVSKSVFTINSIDPNEKNGNSGALSSPYINSLFPINYFIHFENADTATAPAQTVLLIDTLDKIKLDLNTFQLTSIGFADTIISIPTGRKSFTTNVDLQPNLPLIVQMTAYLNDTTGILTAFYFSLDPLTMEPTTNPFLGFLLPNDSTGRGEGFVSFSVNAQSSVLTGDTINNKADIFFDANAPITTPIWTNIIDNLKPQGQVISATQIANTDSINVAWISTDNGPAGVYVHNVYYNVNGGEWLLWKYNTSLTSDVFVGVMDSTYSFYSVAIDSAYNIEDAPLAPDAITTLTVGLEEITQSQMLVKLFPNPANSSISIFIKRFDKSKTDFNIIARDITGRKVSNKKINIATDTKTFQLNISQFVNGIYFIEITNGEHRTFKKLIKN